MIGKILIDNISKNDLIGEWGLSLYIAYEGHKILLDTGTTGAFVENAKHMGVPLHEVEYGVLSHAHYDHADGMPAFFGVNQKAQFYLRDGTKENCYDGKGEDARYIGIGRGILEQYKDRITYVSGDYELFPGVYLIPHKVKGLDAVGRQINMYIKEGNEWQVDVFAHEQSLVLKVEEGLVIFNSCSHAGADTIVNEILETFPDTKIAAFIGGFHLYKSSEAQVRAFVDRIKKTGIERIITGHCTGEAAFAILKEELGDVVQQMYTGMEIRIGE